MENEKPIRKHLKEIISSGLIYRWDSSKIELGVQYFIPENGCFSMIQVLFMNLTYENLREACIPLGCGFETEFNQINREYTFTFYRYNYNEGTK